MVTAIGQVAVRVSEPRDAVGEEQPAVSGVYRNKAAVDGLPETYSECATLYELFNKSVELYPTNRHVLACWRRCIITPPAHPIAKLFCPAVTPHLSFLPLPLL
jgi:hypothetical protein